MPAQLTASATRGQGHGFAQRAARVLVPMRSVLTSPSRRILATRS